VSDYWVERELVQATLVMHELAAGLSGHLQVLEACARDGAGPWPGDMATVVSELVEAAAYIEDVLDRHELHQSYLWRRARRRGEFDAETEHEVLQETRERFDLTDRELGWSGGDC
jgi:hypothetical protein